MRMLLLLILFLTGCLKSPKDEQATTDPPEFDSIPLALYDDEPQQVTTHKLTSSGPETFPEIVPASSHAEPAPPPNRPPKKTGYTGAVVHVGDDCTPCHFLVQDLLWLVQHGWTVDETGKDQSADWVISRKHALQLYPTIEFFRDGQSLNIVTGYSTSENFAQRQTILRELVRDHPRNRGH